MFPSIAHRFAIKSHGGGPGRRRDGSTRAAEARAPLRLDAGVAAWFRAAGPGHLTRMNAVLRCYMLAREAEVV